jgi:hypothetical protein
MSAEEFKEQIRKDFELHDKEMHCSHCERLLKEIFEIHRDLLSATELLGLALDLLQELGWETFGAHSGDEPIPFLEFWGEDEAGMPFFEKVVE